MDTPSSATTSAPARRAGAKIAYVETLRGIACILLVSYHVIGDTNGNGLQLPEGHDLQFLNSMFIDVRMPLFSFIAGPIMIPWAALKHPLPAMLLLGVRMPTATRPAGVSAPGRWAFAMPFSRKRIDE